jgi:hypothetical protein
MPQNKKQPKAPTWNLFWMNGHKHFSFHTWQTNIKSKGEFKKKR